MVGLGIGECIVYFSSSDDPNCESRERKETEARDMSESEGGLKDEAARLKFTEIRSSHSIQEVPEP